jgi:hypothetical protein
LLLPSAVRRATYAWVRRSQPIRKTYRDRMQRARAVGLPVATSVEPVPHDLARRGFYRRDPAEAGQRRLALQPRSSTSWGCPPPPQAAWPRGPCRRRAKPRAQEPPRRPLAARAGSQARRSPRRAIGITASHRAEREPPRLLLRVARTIAGPKAYGRGHQRLRGEPTQGLCLSPSGAVTRGGS